MVAPVLDFLTGIPSVGVGLEITLNITSPLLRFEPRQTNARDLRPATSALMLAGLGLVGVIARRRKQRAA